MKRTVLTSLLLGMVVPMADSSRIRGWRGIIPLHSTRSDVERLLGPGTNECKCGYYLDDVNVFFVYSFGDCKSGGTGGWNIPPDTVIRFVVYPKRSLSLANAGIDESKFEKSQAGHIASVVSYKNDEKGLLIEVNEDTKMVTGFYYGPAAGDKALRCR